MRKLMVLLVGLFAVLNLHAAGAKTAVTDNPEFLAQCQAEPVSVEKKRELAKTLINVAITGAFGFNFGDVMDEAALKRVNARYPRTVSGNTTYVVQPPERFSTFQEYTITITPNTKRIARIFAVVTCGDTSIDIAEFKNELYSALKTKYGDFTDQVIYEQSGTRIATLIDKSNPKRQINITINKSMIYLEYKDDEIFRSEKKPNVKAL